MTRFLCFDVDGTIVNSRELVRQAYLSVGVVMPNHAWGTTWQNWLIDYFAGDTGLAQSTHKAKTNAYEELLLRADAALYELPAADLARTWLRNYGQSVVSYLTAGTATTAWSWVYRLGIAAPLTGELTYESRLAKLKALPDGTVYLDDNIETIAKLAVDAPHLHRIHIQDQDYYELLDEVRGV